MNKWRDRTTRAYRANGINYSIQMRSLNWQEIDARAERIVNDPSRRDTPVKKKATEEASDGI